MNSPNVGISICNKGTTAQLYSKHDNLIKDFRDDLMK
jgi:hypothetical protein